ncbi:MAG: C40 family peptidase [Pseudoalteromonas sp.]
MSSNNEMFSLAEIAMLFIGTPYVWGGNNITTGLDCGALVAEASRSCGLLDKRDLNAQGLHKYFLPNSISSEIKKDAVLFFGKSVKNITHVAIAINEKQMVEAGGEGRTPTDKGYVRIRPISNRRDLIAVLNLKNPCHNDEENILGDKNDRIKISRICKRN